MDRTYVAENDAERARLKALVEGMSDEQLSRPMAAGWTVAAVLAHMAFWDARSVVLIDKWESGVAPSEADHEPPSDWINDAAKPLCLALAPRAAAHLALEMAEQADQRVAAMSDALLAQFIAIGTPFDLFRANHRREHIDEIEAAL